MANDLYRFTGMKNPGDRTRRIIVEGSASDPKRFVDKGGVIELTEDELEDVKGLGAQVKKLSEDESKAHIQKLEEDRKAAANKRGADQTNPGAVLRQRAEQEEEEDDNATEDEKTQEQHRSHHRPAAGAAGDKDGGKS